MGRTWRSALIWIPRGDYVSGELLGKIILKQDSHQWECVCGWGEVKEEIGGGLLSQRSRGKQEFWASLGYLVSTVGRWRQEDWEVKDIFICIAS